MLKTYSSKVVAIDCFGGAVVEIPDEMIEELGWEIGDILNYTIEGESIIITNTSKDKRDGRSSTNSISKKS